MREQIAEASSSLLTFELQTPQARELRAAIFSYMRAHNRLSRRSLVHRVLCVLGVLGVQHAQRQELRLRYFESSLEDAAKDLRRAALGAFDGEAFAHWRSGLDEADGLRTILAPALEILNQAFAAGDACGQSTREC